MRKLKSILILALLLGALLASAQAGELKGCLDGVNAENCTLTMSGITIFTQDALFRNQLDQPVPFAALNAGDFVVIDGDFAGQGQFSAKRIQLDYYGKDVIKGLIESVNLNDHSVYIAGVKVQVTSATWLDDSDDMMIDFIQLVPGSNVRCTGHWTGSLQFTADRIELKEPTMFKAP